MTHNETRVSNDMRRAQAETVPEERLKHMANSPAHIMQSSAPVSLRSGELRGMAEEILASRQALYAHPIPNPSPSDGVVSEAAALVYANHAGNFLHNRPFPLPPGSAEWADYSPTEQASARLAVRAIEIALQSKRGQP